MNIKQYQVDAFATRAFEGNPAAICPLKYWLDDGLLQAIAEENNLSETAFFVPSEKNFQLRWFTPVKEVDLCGHATLASAHVIFEVLGYAEPVITFETRSGELFVEKRENRLRMDFPACPPVPCAEPVSLLQGLGVRPTYNPSLQIVEVSVKGYISGRDLHEVTSQAAALGKAKGTNKCLVDTEAMERVESFVEVLSLPDEQYAAEEVDRLSRIAVIKPRSAETQEVIQFYKNACVNRGWMAKVTPDRREAVDWLLSDFVPNNTLNL